MKKLVEVFLKVHSLLDSPEYIYPDDQGTVENHEIFRWDDVEMCMGDKIEPVSNRLPCPICGKPSEELDWISFSSPKWTWDNLMGRIGPMSICTDCHCQVEFICMVMN